VYRCPDLRLGGFGDLVYKEYKQLTRARSGPALLPGLLSLVRFRDNLEAARRTSWDTKTVWPLRVVVDGAAAVGIIMQVIPSAYFSPILLASGATTTKPAEIDLLLGADEDMRQRGLPELSVATRLRICAQIVSTYAMVHQADIIAGDISARNVVFQHDPTATRVLLVDCDSARPRGARSAFGDQPHTPNWEPPEALAAIRRLQAARRDPKATASVNGYKSRAMSQSKETDVYKVGLLLMRILDHGRGKTRNRDPRQALATLRRHTSRELADILQSALDPSPQNRPRLIDWNAVWRGRRPGEARVNSAYPSVPAVTAAVVAEPPQGQRVNGNWTWVDGVGWMRSADLHSAPVQP
jgi:hypothetical protein